MARVVTTQTPGGRDPLQQMIIDQLKALGEGQQRGFDSLRAEFNQRLDRLVTTEAFTAEQRRVDERLASLGQDIVDERLARQDELNKAIADRKDAFDKVHDRIAKLTANMRWIASSVLLPIGLFVAGLVFGKGS